MLTPDRIVLTTDFTENASTAYPHAIALARASGAELILTTVVTVYDEHDDVVEVSPAFPEYAKQVEERAREKLEALALPDADGISVRRVAVRAKNAETGIDQVVRSHNADLVVMATRGRRPISQVMVGSSAIGVIAEVPCPILCVRPEARGFVDDGGTLAIRRILAPTDLSPDSHRGVATAAGVASQNDARLVLLHVVHVEIMPAHLADGMATVFDLDRDMPQRMERKLRQFAADIDTRGIEVGYHVSEGSAKKRIVHVANEMKADLVVITPRGRHGKRSGAGSVCRQLLHETPSPLLIV